MRSPFCYVQVPAWCCPQGLCPKNTLFLVLAVCSHQSGAVGTEGMPCPWSPGHGSQGQSEGSPYCSLFPTWTGAGSLEVHCVCVLQSLSLSSWGQWDLALGEDSSSLFPPFYANLLRKGVAEPCPCGCQACFLGALSSLKTPSLS